MSLNLKFKKVWEPCLFQAVSWDLLSLPVVSVTLPPLSVPELSCSHSRPDKFPNNLEPDTGEKVPLRSVDGHRAL